MDNQPKPILVQQVVNEVSNINPDLGEWINEGLDENGPWLCKTNPKEQVNCFLRYHLCQVREDTSDLREYLTSEDEDDVWISALVKNVAPVLGRHTPIG